MKQVQGAGSLANRRIEIDIAEPDYYVHEGTNKRRGIVRRLLSQTNKVGDRVPFVVVELDTPLHWEDSNFRVISLMARFRKPLSTLSTGKKVVVNINGEQEWILDAPDDDPRLTESEGSRWLGYGVASLAELG